MKSVVIYASRTGNTQAIAQVVAEELGTRGQARLLSADEAPAALPKDTDLLVIGGPTEGHGMTDAITHFLDRLDLALTPGVAAAAFDTRLSWPKWLAGSAAGGIAQRLERLGARIIAPAESFIVTTKPLLEPGERERAAAWAETLASAIEAKAAAAAGG